MVGIVLVSHSRALALSVQELVRAMTGPALPLAIAAGAGQNHQELGTDAVEISEAISRVKGADGVLVLMDMGSAILSSETALDLLDDSARTNVRFCAAPFVEGAVASGVTANLGASLDEVCAEALAALKQKEAALNPTLGAEDKSSRTTRQPTEGSPAQGSKKARLTIRNRHGLHARPAARLITEMRPFHCEIALRNLSNQRGPVSLKSLSSLASLEILQDNEIEVTASGDDAAAALEKITQLVESGLGDDLSAPKKARAPAPRQNLQISPVQAVALTPVPISNGIALGPAIYFQAAALEIPQEETDDVAAEIEHLQTAITSVRKSLENRREQMTATVGARNAGIYEAQSIALQDPELVNDAIGFIQQGRANAALAWNRSNRQVVRRYESLQDPYLRERACDLEDVGRQVLESLVARKATGPELTGPAILIADNLTPFQVSALPKERVLGVILLDGGPTAHASILLKALGIPAVVQARSFFDGTNLSHLPPIAFDGSSGRIWLDPDERLTAELRSRQGAEQKRHAEETKACSLPAETRDGHIIEIFANVGSASEVEAALQSGAEGVGLLRTEFLFLERDSAPTEDEQRETLLAIAEKMGDRPLVVRTLDIGGDKQVPYLPMAPEENPFLGVRALRLCFSHADLFNTQLRAILRAGRGRDFRIMFPMVANFTDLDLATACLEKVHRDLEMENVPHLWPVKTGIMIEIPSAALLAESLARQADFFSIGTNDLTQYTLAADRGNAELAGYQDALHPSVLRLMEMVVNGARQHNRAVSVCGEAASDERAAAVFVGLGVQELSVSGAKIPHIKAILRRHSLAHLQQLAHSALHCQTAAEVRALKVAN
jgi:phosphoenolpyruvate-protein phosphotransferase/dihydroxyacetone kinase phosphotransfer subunit